MENPSSDEPLLKTMVLVRLPCPRNLRKIPEKTHGNSGVVNACTLHNFVTSRENIVVCGFRGFFHTFKHKNGK